MIALWLKNHLAHVKIFLFLASSLPLLRMVLAYFTDALGPNPLETLTRSTGFWSLFFLMLTLSVTPSRKLLADIARWRCVRYGKRVSDWNWLVRLRRQLGLWSFVYALLHGWIFLAFDAAYDWAVFWQTCQEKPYLFLGLTALLMLVPLAFTSANIMIRLLGRYWLWLHRTVYLIAVLVLAHDYLQLKSGSELLKIEFVVISLLLLYRLGLYLGWARRWDGANGLEVKDR